MRSQVISKGRVFVGLSGGVDSSVSAALLKKAGYEVTGVFIRVWQSFFARASEGNPDFFVHCTSADDRLDAMRVCAKLQIPFRELNLEKEYKKEVVNYMIREYRAGRTPNPDSFCNRFIKFGAFYDWAMKNGADFVATGHYARIEKGRLLAGSDKDKDQSYFLSQIRREQLSRILFPIGEMKKTEVRALAKKFGLITADKKDSQGLCFVGKVDMKEFLKHYIKQKPGRVLDEKGTVVGMHNGAAFYTIGERFGVSGSASALFVVAKDMKQNTLTISPKSRTGALAEMRNEVEILGCNWVSGAPRASKTYGARLRYRQPLQKCRILRGTILFEKPQIVAPGQSLVLYDGEICLGGGILV